MPFGLNRVGKRGSAIGFARAGMPGANAAQEMAVSGGDDLYDRIGEFLSLHGLSPDPAHYTFAFQVLVNPKGPIAEAVARLADGGVRLARQDIERLGGSVAAGAPITHFGEENSRRDDAERLASETCDQMANFALVVERIHDETLGFGRDLAASAAAIRQVPQIEGIDEIARITGAMLERVHDAEIRLAQAAEEVDELREKLEEAQSAARSDPLTGLPNRRAFEEAFAAHDWTTGNLCLAVCDIDRFKRINDDFGHAVGDRVLTAIGETLAGECAGHLVARHGGEEFAVLIVGKKAPRAAAILDSARAVVAAKRFRARETSRPLGQITLSAGVTAVSQGESVDLAFDRADRMLYAAKAAGRNCVHHD